MKYSTLVLFVFITISCSNESTEIADYVYKNGKIYTVNKNQPWIEAIAVKDGEILHTGTSKEMEKFVGDSTKLISDMRQYVEHITEHLWKENNRLFMMAEARLQYVSEKVDKELNDVENSKLKELGKSREHYEQLVETLTKDVSDQGS